MDIALMIRWVQAFLFGKRPAKAPQMFQLIGHISQSQLFQGFTSWDSVFSPVVSPIVLIEKVFPFFTTQRKSLEGSFFHGLPHAGRKGVMGTV